jgi:hypothetical protein
MDTQEDMEIKNGERMLIIIGFNPKCQVEDKESVKERRLRGRPIRNPFQK